MLKAKVRLSLKKNGILLLFLTFLIVGFISSSQLSLLSDLKQEARTGDFGAVDLFNLGINPWAQERPPEYKQKIAELSSSLSDLCMEGRGEDEAVRCLFKELQGLAEKNGARLGLDVVVALAEDHAYLNNHSHDLSHVVGFGALRYNYPITETTENIDGLTAVEVNLIDRMGRALVDCYSWGVMGCMHGVIEAGLGGVPADRRTQAARRACLANPFVQSNQVFVNHCLHWLGHGMAIFTNQGLLETLKICESLDPDFSSENVQLCLSGVFHAGVSPGRTDEEDWYLHNIQKVYNKDDIYYPCRDIPEKFATACYAALPGRVGGYGLEKLYEACHNIPEPNKEKKDEYLKVCYDTVSNILLYTVEHKADNIIETCRQYSDKEYLKYCYAGAVRYLILRTPLKNNNTPYEICEKIEADAKSACYKSLGAVVNETYYNEQILKEYCDKVKESEYRKDCLSRGTPGS